MPEKSILIIGAGPAGLSAGCYARMNAYRVTLLEQDSRPGGLCTSWQRGNYTIHGNVAFLGGSGPGIGFHRLWQELGVCPSIKMIDYDYFLIVEGSDGRKLSISTDVDRLEGHLKELGPDDEARIAQFVNGIRTFIRYDLPVEKAQELLSPFDKLKFVFKKFPLVRAASKWGKISIKEFALGFRTPLLREAFLEFELAFSEELPVALIMASLAWSHKKTCGYPAGGAIPFMKAIEKRLLDLGGDIRFSSRVVKILVENGRAVGVRTSDGQEHFADYIISAADGRRTIFDWLEGKYVDSRIEGYYRTIPVTSAAVLVGLGVARTFTDLPRSAAGWVFFPDEPVVLGGRELRSLRPMIYNFDPTLSPPGKTLIRLLLPADWDFWDALRNDPARYQAEKRKIAETVISHLDRRYPGLAGQVEMRDVATPLTFERYTGNWKGSLLGWDLTTKTFLRPMRKTLPGLENFYMAGHWVEPGGGIPGSAASGRNAIQLIARKDRKRFNTLIP